MSTALIIDTETTKREDPEVIELAWKVYNGPGESVQRFCPRGPIEWGAMAVHHILPEELVGLQASSEALRTVPDAEYWIGHNVDFDWNALFAPPGVKRICTLAMSRLLWPELDSHSLGAMMYFLSKDHAATRERLRSAHSAFADVEFCQELLAAICAVAKLDPADLRALWAFSEDARVPRIMTFGKYKGRPVSDVDRGYMNWYARQPDTDPYVLEAFRRNGF